MTVKEAARALEVSEALVYKLCRRGLLGHARLGASDRGVIRISPDQVEAYRAARVVAPAPPDGEGGPGAAAPPRAGARDRPRAGGLEALEALLRERRKAARS